MKNWVLVSLVVFFSHSWAYGETRAVSKDGYIIGGTVGSIAGFGIGHAIQERYISKGWVFTLADSLSLFSAWALPWILEISGVKNLAPHIIRRVGWTSFATVRLWQITDLWVLTRPKKPVLTDALHEKPWQNGWWGEQKLAQTPTIFSLLKTSF